MNSRTSRILQNDEDKSESGLPNSYSEAPFPPKINTQEKYEPKTIHNSEEMSTVLYENNISDENATPENLETIEIIDDLGNLINNIHDLDGSIQNEWKEQQIVVIETQMDEEDQAEKKIEEREQKPRKRKLDPPGWKLNVRKKKCQSGEEYVNVRGKVVKARSIQNKKNCLHNCKFNCARQISEDERKQAFNSYWSLTQNEKYLFLRNTTKKSMKGRKTTGDNVSRRCYSFTYFIQVKGEDIRVCKRYFLETFNISQKPVYTAQLVPNEIKRDNRGKQSRGSAKKEEVMTHIKSFPVIDSHYCRQTTKRKYLEANLSVAKMYGLYTKWCHDNDTTAVKLSYYRYIFTTEFNYGFHVPKKDRCIKCESYKIKTEENTLTSDEKDTYQKHIEIKSQMRMERNKDRESKVPTLCFDLENVITCPRSEVGDFFYSQKLSIYNLTGHFSTTGQTYCAIWNEAKQGRSGNILASAFRKILDQVLEDNNITALVTWSDSCVSQNRNSFISFAVIDAMRDHPELETVTMKYSVPGHGAIQEVDNAHSNIERYMNKTEFYSPLSFIKNLKSVNTKKPYCILQMKDEDYKDFESCAKKLSFNKIPFSKVASLRFTQSLSEIEYKLNHADDFMRETLKPQRATARRNQSSQNPGNNVTAISKSSLILTLKPKVLCSKNSLSEDKVKAIKKMMTGCMPELDKKYFASFLNTLK